MKKYLYIASLIAIMAFTSTARAQKQEFDPTLFFKRGDAELIKTTKGPEGWLLHIVKLSSNGRETKIIMWENVESQIVTVGRVFDRTGRELNSLAQEKHGTTNVAISLTFPLGTAEVPEEISSADGYNDNLYKAHNALAQLSSDHYTGDSNDDSLFVFYDYFCTFCAKTHDSLKSLTKKPIKWVPVATLNQNSILYGAGVLDGAIGMEGVGKPLTVIQPDPTEKSKISVIENTALMESLGVRPMVTPTIVYKTKSGLVRVIQGNPTENDIAEIKAES